MSALREAAARALDAGRPERAWDEVAAALASDSARERVTARRLLLAIAPRVHETAWTDDRQATARRIGAPPPRGQDRPGVVSFPVVGASGEGRFVAVEARLISDAADQLPEALGAETRRALLDALQGARALLGEENTSFSLHFDGPLDWAGDSAGLAVALAAVSAARSIAVPAGIAATGALRASGEVGRVGKVYEKLRLRQDARPRCRLLVPQGEAVPHPALIPVASLGEAWRALAGPPIEDLEAALEVARRLDRQGESQAAARAAEPLLEHPDASDEERLELLVLLLAAANHNADVEAQARWSAALREALPRWESHPRAPLARALGARAVARVDALDLAGARAALALAEAWRWSRAEQVHLRGPAALIATLSGEHAAALALRAQSAEEAASDERPRCLGDWADALLRVGRAEEALERADQALGEAGALRRRKGYAKQTTAWLHLHRARALQALGREEQALAALELPARAPGLDPSLRAALTAAELRRDGAAVARARQDLPAWAAQSPLVAALVDRSLARLGDAAAADRLLVLPVFAGLDLVEAGLRLPY